MLATVRVLPKVELVLVTLYVVVLGLKPESSWPPLSVSCAKSALAPVTASIKVTATVVEAESSVLKVITFRPLDPPPEIGKVGMVEPAVTTKLLVEKPPLIRALLVEPLET